MPRAKKNVTGTPSSRRRFQQRIGGGCRIEPGCPSKMPGGDVTGTIGSSLVMPLNGPGMAVRAPAPQTQQSRLRPNASRRRHAARAAYAYCLEILQLTRAALCRSARLAVSAYPLRSATPSGTLKQAQARGLAPVGGWSVSPLQERSPEAAGCLSESHRPQHWPAGKNPPWVVPHPDSAQMTAV